MDYESRNYAAAPGKMLRDVHTDVTIDQVLLKLTRLRPAQLEWAISQMQQLGFDPRD